MQKTGSRTLLVIFDFKKKKKNTENQVRCAMFITQSLLLPSRAGLCLNLISLLVSHRLSRDSHCCRFTPSLGAPPGERICFSDPTAATSKGAPRSSALL